MNVLSGDLTQHPTPWLGTSHIAEDNNQKRQKATRRILMCFFNHEEAKGSQATILIIIACVT